MHSKYLPHIDGIRCLAILAVFLNHLSPAACPGGFIGVDIFFVVSGYLICGGIIDRLDRGTFTFSDFFYRRIRRILPNYFAVTAVTLLVGVALYHCGRLATLGETALSGSLFSTNMYLWICLGYFTPTAEQNPLRHLWSLGVEEQFYLTIPFLIWVIWKLRPGSGTSVMVAFWGLAAISFTLCQGFGQVGLSNTAFYLFPLRAWELLLGALICRLRPAEPGRAQRLVPLLALATILVSLWSIHYKPGGGTSVELRVAGASLGSAPFPSWVLLPSLLATTALLRYGALGVAGSILQNRWPVFIGKLSFSLYLWHWPVIVFGRYITYWDWIQSPWWFNVVSGAVSFALAYGAWRWIEQPFRSDRFKPRMGIYLCGRLVCHSHRGLHDHYCDGRVERSHPQRCGPKGAPRLLVHR